LLKGHAAVADAKHSTHPLQVQQLGGVTDGKQLFFTPNDGTGWVEVDFKLDQDEQVELYAKMVRSWDYGIYRVLLDGKQLAQLDLYDPAVTPFSHRLGAQKLAAGTHTLRFECAGKTAKSAGYFLGFDALAARIPAYSRAPTVDLRTLQKKK
jgi:hypothetical protein